MLFVSFFLLAAMQMNQLNIIQQGRAPNPNSAGGLLSPSSSQLVSEKFMAYLEIYLMYLLLSCICFFFIRKREQEREMERRKEVVGNGQNLA